MKVNEYVAFFIKSSRMVVFPIQIRVVTDHSENGNHHKYHTAAEFPLTPGNPGRDSPRFFFKRLKISINWYLPLYSPS